ncbi:hypothetical protein NPX13_g6566 [Xylaria arbuscula]|uniref:Uncharacterized protein n=1 Tax=Xylaria arbuscula TaxID=114810 RepID=A0A9W8NBY9_9PEZI|nr:hypothetical protein NPX13_g6566 [Xylaria arbuscula]
MIARSAPSGAVCLRCQLRLLHQIRPLPVRYVTTNAAAATSTAADAGANTDANANRADDRGHGQDAVQDTLTEAGTEHRFKRRGKPLLGRSYKHFKPQKRHMAGDRILNEVARSLNHDMLGKPAYAIVMKDGGKVAKRKASLKQYEVGIESGSPSIEAVLDSQQEPVTTDATRSYIQSLRPKSDKVLTRKEFEKLQDRLTSGFLVPQLQDYVIWYKSNAAQATPTASDSSPQRSYPRMKERSAWVPLQSETSVLDGINHIFEGYVSDTTTPKQRLAIRLMRECWDLSIADLQTQLGETWVKLENYDFITLMRGTQRFMNTLVKIWLEPGEQIEAFRNQKMLRIVTTKHKADAVLGDLNETLKSIETKTFPIVLLGSEKPDETILEQVGKITNSHVRLSHTARRLHVTWIDVKSRAARGLIALEDISHIVFRLLLTASGAKQVTSSLLSPTLSESRRGRLIVDATSKEKFSWKDRLTQWARYVYPLTPEKDVTDATLAIKKFELPFQPLARVEPLEDDFKARQRLTLAIFYIHTNPRTQHPSSRTF